MVPKRKFEFVPFEGVADIYANGQKLRSHHDARKGHVYFHIASDQDVKIEAYPHDPRIAIEVEVKDGKVVPAEVERPVKPKEPIYQAPVSDVRRVEKANQPFAAKQPVAIEQLKVADYGNQEQPPE